MKRTAADRTARQPKPVERIEVKEGGTKKRIVLLIVAIIVALGAFTYAIVTLLNEQNGIGWREIEATSASEMNCAQDFTFRYYLGGAGVGAAAENKALSMLYTEATEKAYQIFNAREASLTTNNLFYLNRTINQPVQVDPALYAAFEKVEKAGSRYMYLGPVFQDYTSLFFCIQDWETEGIDPYRNEEQRAYLQMVADFARDPSHIQLELMGDNTVQLHVSDSYQAFTREYGISDYLDFYILQDAFIIDYLADTIHDAGYTLGVISSHDGYTRCLNENRLGYENPLFLPVDEKNVTIAAQVSFPGGTNLVQLHERRMNTQKELYYYQFENGDMRTAYLDEKDALCKATLPVLMGTSREKGCAEIAMALLPFYAADDLDKAGLDDLAGEGIYPLYSLENTIYTFDPQVQLEVQEEYSVVYAAEN